MAVITRRHASGINLGPRYANPRLLRTGSRFVLWTAERVGADGNARPVVVKVPDPRGATWTHEVLRREARMLAKVGGHPYVVRLYDTLTLHDGRPALVFERYRRTAADHLRTNGPLHVVDAVSIGIKIAGALDAAHNVGMLHCDVRPDNVLLGTDGEPALSGWDETVPIGESAARAPQHLTTAHTAPELLEGGSPTQASDTYGLAATVYELVSGNSPFREYPGESAATVIIRVLSGTVAPLVLPGVPLELSDLLTWGLSVDPDRRPPSPAWLAEEFARIASREGWRRPHRATGESLNTQ